MSEKLKVVICPEMMFDEDAGYKIFMAGGITGCEDWQSSAIAMMQLDDRSNDLILVNPRRPDFDTSSDASSEYQIKWEYNHLRRVDEVVVWFPKEGRCMITLFELGWLLGANIPVSIGCHPEYVRAYDVKMQVGLRRPDIKIFESWLELYQNVLDKRNQVV